MRPLSAALLGLFLIGAAHAAPYAWKGSVGAAFRAPTDRVQEGIWRGAALQGGLVDIRYGQVAVDLGGVAEVLETDASSVLTLNGSPITAEELLKQIPDDLAVAVRFAPDTGKVGWLDAFSDGQGMPAVDLGKAPVQGEAYKAREMLTLTLSSQEWKRLGQRSCTATIPGVAHDLKFSPTRAGGCDVVLKVMPGWNFRDVPVFLETGGRVYRGPRLTFSTTAPAVTGFGPSRASAHSENIHGWVDVRSEGANLLQPTSARLTVAPGLKVLEFQPRVDRSVFVLRADSPGEYWVEFRIADRMGRKLAKRWPLQVLP